MSSNNTATTRLCDACGLPPRLYNDGQTPIPLRRCSRCQRTWYHDRECQRRHFFAGHKQACRRNTTTSTTRNDTETLFRVEERSGRGRCLVACQSISAKQPIADSFAALVPPVLNQANRGVRCALCFGMLNPSCFYTYEKNVHSHQYPVMFCSMQCRQRGNAWLSEEEQFVVQLCQQSEARGQTIQVLPTAILLYRILRNIAEQEFLQCTAVQQSTLRTKIDALEAHDAKLSSDEETHLQAVITLAKCLLDQRAQVVSKQEESLSQSFSVNYMRQTISRIKTNGFSICDGESVALGMGLFETASKINHSCRPNALQTFLYGQQGTPPTLRVTACRAIAPNEEICISYIDNAIPRQMRRQRLSDDYHFECTCVSCCDDRHDDTLVGMLCPVKGCSGQAGHSQETVWECTVCGNDDFSAATDLMTAFHSRHDKNNQLSLQDQEHVYAELKANFSPSSWYVCESGEQLVQSLLNAIDGGGARETQRLCARAHAVCNELIEAITTLSDDDSSWRILKRQVLMYKRAKLRLFLLPDPRVAISELQSVMETLSSFYPKDHEFIKGIQDTLTQAFS